MSFTFVYRCLYNNPTGRFIRRFPNHTILSWFQESWDTYQPYEDGYCQSIFGQQIYGFDSFFEKVDELKLPKPETHEQLAELLKKHVYAEVGTNVGPQVFEVFTDDDEVDLRYLFVEDSFAESHPDKCKFLLHEQSLPTEISNTNPVSEPCTWLYLHGPVQSADSQTWDIVKCPGVRLDNSVPTIEAYEKLKESRSFVEAEHYLAAVAKIKTMANPTWQRVLNALLKEAKAKKDGSADESKTVFSDHICQLHHHAETWNFSARSLNLFHQIVVFDDIWAANYPNLASSIEHYAKDLPLVS